MTVPGASGRDASDLRDPAALLVDDDERRRAIEDLDTTFLVEAAAGSGKTTLLLGRIVNLVRSGRARLAEIAAVTFTEKAAADLRVRLRGELARAGLHEALRELEIARIGTIHAFAAGLLRERPVEAGVDPGFTVADPLTARLLLDRAWEAWLPEALSDPSAAETVRQAIERGLGLERLRDLAFALVDARDRLGGLPDPEPYAGAARRPERGGSRDDRAARRARAGRRQGSGGPRGAGARGPGALGPPDGGLAGGRSAERAPRPGAAARTSPRSSATRRSGGTRPRWRNAGPGSSRSDERVEAARAVARHNLVAGLARWAAGFAAAYGLAKGRAGCLDFLDLLLGARDLVRDRADVRRDFQRGIRYLLVDEFQDTDPLQLEMVLSLAEGAPAGSLFVVGDPKQSIYRFRRADIETYEDAQGTLAGRGEVLTIRANFRSSAAVLDAVNRRVRGRHDPAARRRLPAGVRGARALAPDPARRAAGRSRAAAGPAARRQRRPRPPRRRRAWSPPISGARSRMRAGSATATSCSCSAR